MSIAARVQAAATFVPNLYRDLFIQVEIPIFLQSLQHYANVSYNEHLEGGIPGVSKQRQRIS
jgi:hypothetical protein